MDKSIASTTLSAYPTQQIECANDRVTFEHIPALDGMRAIAVLMVVIFHAILLVPSIKPFVNGGFMGVDVFFVLSGFLITSILLKEYDRTETINFKNFYMRRLLRLMPAYWLHLVLLFVFAGLVLPQTETDKLHSNNNFLFSFLYLSNWHRALNGSEITGLLSHTWSLAIEEQFYLFWAGFLFIILNRFSRQKIVAITVGLIVFTMLFRIYRWNGHASVDFLYNAFDSRVDALLVGCLASQLMAWNIIPKRFLSSRAFDLVGLLAVWVSIVILFNLSAAFYSPFLYLGGFTIFALAIGIIIIWVASRSKTRYSDLLSARPLVWIGKTSYGLYLWHSIAISIVFYSDIPAVAKLPTALALAFSMTALSYYLVEVPFLKLKSRFS